MTRIVRVPHIFQWRKFLFIVLALGCLRASAAENFLVEPIPAWTSPIDVDTNENVLEKTASQGVFFLLVDTEVNGATSERYLRLAESQVAEPAARVWRADVLVDFSEPARAAENVKQSRH